MNPNPNDHPLGLQRVQPWRWTNVGRRVKFTPAGEPAHRAAGIGELGTQDQPGEQRRRDKQDAGFRLRYFLLFSHVRNPDIAMIGAGLAAWVALSAAASSAAAVPALTIYNLLATIYLAYLGVGGQLVGILPWPAVALHLVLLILLVPRWLAAGGK